MRRVAAAVVALGVVLPLVPVLIWSVSATWRFPDLVPPRMGTRGLDLIASKDVLGALTTSTYIAVVVAALACLIGLPAGRVIGLHRFRGRTALQFLILAPVIVPGLAVTLGLQVFFIRYGLSDTVVGVVLVQLVLTVPYATTILGAAFANFDVDLERQSRTLGAGPLRTTLLVTVPALAPALMTTAILAFLISWSEYVLTVLIGGGQVQTLPLLLFGAIGSSDTTAAAALGLLVVVPPVIMMLLASRWLARGSTPLMGLARV